MTSRCWLQLHDVEAELEAEQRRGRDVVAENRKLARLLQELRAQAEEDHRVATELQDTVNTLTLKINTLKRQLLEAVSPIYQHAGIEQSAACHTHSAPSEKRIPRRREVRGEE